MSDAPAMAELRFLVVEDHGFQRWALANTLTAMGALEVMSASDGGGALEIMDGLDGGLDIIVTDLDMPGMDGLEFIRHVGERGAPVAVVLASGLDASLVSTVENMAKAYGVHLLATLQKPVTAKKLAAVLQGYRRAGGNAPPQAAPLFHEQEIREGVANGEFEPFFQAKVRMQDSTVAGAEALARWRHPVKGMIPQSGFMAAVEKAGLGESLALAIAARSARACKVWRAQGLPGSVAINLSSAVLGRPELAQRLLEVIYAENIEPAHVTVEVPDSAGATPEALENLARLRMHGFGLSIDDYGTGSSPMERLTQVAFTELKIDRSFVRDALLQRSSRALLESSLEIAKRMRITAVAEGVERTVEWDLLSAMGCDQAQGFLIARPADEASYLEWLRQQVRSREVRSAGQAIPVGNIEAA